MRIALVLLVALAFVTAPLSNVYADVGNGWNLSLPSGSDGLAYEDVELGLSFEFAVTERAIEINITNNSLNEAIIIWQRSQIRGADGSWDNILTSLRPIKKKDAFSLKEEEPLALQPGKKVYRAVAPAENRIMSSLSVMGYEVKELTPKASSNSTIVLSLYIGSNSGEREMQFVFSRNPKK